VIKYRSQNLKPIAYLLLILSLLVVFFLCVCIGSVTIPIHNIVSIIVNLILNKPIPEGVAGMIILQVRIPRVLCVAFVGAALSICGAAMQGVLRNPLADGTTIGVSSGASLGAVLAIAFGFSIPGIENGGVVLMAMVFAFISLLFIIALAYKLDCTLSTNTIILIGIIFSMFVSSIISFIITFAGEKVKHIMFWTMGSLADSTYEKALTLFLLLMVFGTIILINAEELNAFAISEDNARNTGVDVKRVKLLMLISVAALIGVCVSIGGTIGFVGLVIPHMMRMITGPNHRKSLPVTLFMGAIFLMLADLLARVILKPLELPIGVVTSFVGSIVFVYIFYHARKR
jgi:iron complex transport system permease protein